MKKKNWINSKLNKRIIKTKDDEQIKIDAYNSVQFIDHIAMNSKDE